MRALPTTLHLGQKGRGSLAFSLSLALPPFLVFLVLLLFSLEMARFRLAILGARTDILGEQEMRNGHQALTELEDALAAYVIRGIVLIDA